MMMTGNMGLTHFFPMRYSDREMHIGGITTVHVDTESWPKNFDRGCQSQHRAWEDVCKFHTSPILLTDLNIYRHLMCLICVDMFFSTNLANFKHYKRRFR